MSINNHYYPSIYIKGERYSFAEKNGELIATNKKINSLAVEILTNLPSYCRTNLDKIVWLVKNSINVKQVDNKIVFQPSIFKKSIQTELNIHTSLSNVGFKINNHSKVQEHLQELKAQKKPILNFKIDSPAQLCAANLYLQENIKKEWLNQFKEKNKGFINRLTASDLPKLVYKEGIIIPKKVLLEALVKSHFIDEKGLILKNQGDIHLLETLIGKQQATQLHEVLNQFNEKFMFLKKQVTVANLPLLQKGGNTIRPQTILNALKDGHFVNETGLIIASQGDIYLLEKRLGRTNAAKLNAGLNHFKEKVAALKTYVHEADLPQLQKGGNTILKKTILKVLRDGKFIDKNGLILTTRGDIHLLETRLGKPNAAKIDTCLNKLINKNINFIMPSMTEVDLPDLLTGTDMVISKKTILEVLQTAHLIDANHCMLPNAKDNIHLLKEIFNQEDIDKIMDILFCVSYRSQDTSILSLSTKSRFLDPKILSKMSSYKIGYDEACFLLSSLSVKQKETFHPLITNDLWNDQAVQLIRADNNFLLELNVDPNIEDPNKNYQEFFIRPTQSVKVEGNKINPKNLAQDIETSWKKSQAAPVQEKLKELFNKYEHVIRLFLKYSTTQTQFSNAPMNVTWELDGVQVKDNIELKDSGTVLRRVDFPNAKRKDLAYFSKDESVITHWNKIKADYHLSEAALGKLFIDLYERGSIDAPDEIKKFLAPLVILILGKEVALDHGSHLCNYILMDGVQKGIFNFEEVLNLMPMMPLGAVAAKQFLSHIFNLPLDWIAYSQSGNPKVPPSFFLPYTVTFSGHTAQWMEKYHHLTTAFNKYCSFILENSQETVISHKNINNADRLKMEDVINSLYDQKHLTNIDRLDIDKETKKSDNSNATNKAFLQLGTILNKFYSSKNFHKIDINDKDCLKIKNIINRLREQRHISGTDFLKAQTLLNKFYEGKNISFLDCTGLNEVAHGLHKSSIDNAYIANVLAKEHLIIDQSNQVKHWMIDVLSKFHPLYS